VNERANTTTGSPITGTPITGGAITGEDGLARCAWAATDPLLRAYHDNEWGTTVHGERNVFERISLEAFQAGLSWRTILAKRERFREVFDDFDPERVAALTDHDAEQLMLDVGIVRNRQKIEATRTNARATIALREHGGLDQLVWSFRPASAPAPRMQADVATKTAESSALSKALRRHGFAFVGPTTSYALMEAIGIVDTHLLDCHRRGRCG
jgi:DNA-3-methyladenine glycosylase I